MIILEFTPVPEATDRRAARCAVAIMRADEDTVERVERVLFREHRADDSGETERISVGDGAERIQDDA